MTSRTKGIIISSAVGVVLSVAGLIGASVYVAWQKFAVEDQIHAMFYPVVAGLDEFKNDAGYAAMNLAQITPKYITEIPDLKIVDRIDYTRSADGQDWELSLYSTALSPPRYYVVRSFHAYTEEEKNRVILQYHSIWTVLRE